MAHSDDTSGCHCNLGDKGDRVKIQKMLKVTMAHSNDTSGCHCNLGDKGELKYKNNC